jgi:glycosyltransferase involved in cell wall biosynthesis
MKIAVYAISKNEEEFVSRFCESAKDADLILIADTGSTDETIEKAKSCGAVVHNISVKPWRFDIARDTALCLLPSDIDVCISLDLDEVLEDGWREEIERVWSGDTTRLRYKYDWGSGISFYYEKIHSRNGYHWHHPCHEYPVIDKRIKEVWANTDKLLVSHKPDPTKSRGQYMDLLQLAVDEDPRCPRNAFYYARELTFHHRWLDAVHALNKYLEMPEANWQNERCYAMRLLGAAYEHLGQDGRGWYKKACNESPNTREPWVELAQAEYKRENWQDCHDAILEALKVNNKELVYTMNPAVWGSLPHDLLSISAYHLGMKELAIEHGQKAIDLDKDNERLKNNLLYFKGDKNVPD